MVHHKNGDRSDDDLDNLLLICRTCHGRIHSPLGHGETWDRLTAQLPESALLTAAENEPMKPTSVRVTQTQKEWAELNDMSLEAILRDAINRMMNPPEEATEDGDHGTPMAARKE